MNCPSCDRNNPPESKFCLDCGSALGLECNSCGSSLPPKSRFCNVCGAPVSDQPQPSRKESSPSAPAEQPTSFADGRYTVSRFLGEGGKKMVYLAHDTTLDREVAFALIKTEGLDDTSRTRIQREAQAMGRLGSHPHIVTVFDLGEESGQPFMVTELMGGGDVEGLIEDAPNHRLPLEQAIKIAQETCRGLDFAHSRGIVHRDLKPGNVWLTADGVAKIGDFGLAVSLDRSRLTTEGMMVGTVSYMPPEQAMGGEVTPRSDLYSLGAMLYEMATGRPPFLGDDSVAIIGQHINTPPVAPTWHNRQCPRPLEALIMRLLAKNPSERPESAADVLSALDAIDLSAGVESADAVDETGALDSLAGGVFVGRQREMGELKAALENALSGRGRLVTLVGEPGIGKTRTAAELATYAGMRSAQVLWGRCYEGEGAPPYWPWVQAIRSYVRDVDPEQLKSDMGAGAADIAEVVSDVREQLPGLQTPPQLEPEQARFRLFDSITAFLKSAGRRQPLVLVLDDLQWADHSSLLLLEFVARELGGARLLIVGTYRDVELSRQHPLSHTLGELTRSAEGGFQRVLLRGLGQEDVGRFIELASGVTPPTGLAAAVHRQTEGNPLFVTEVVRLLVQEGELAQDSAGERDSWSVRIPEGVRDVIGRRLDRLSERCNEILTIASVVGREFAIELLSPLIEDISGDRLLEVMDEALSSRVIEELPQSVGRYQFTHALIQETLIGELSLTRRVRVHARIAEALEELYGASAEAHSTELAYHCAQAESLLGTEKLVKYSLLAGEKALASYAWEEALAIFQRGLAATAGQEMGAEAAALLFGLGRAQAATLPRIRTQEAVDTLTRAFDLYVAVGHVSEALSVADYQVFPIIGITQVNQLIGRALNLVHPDSLQAGRLLCRYGSALASETNKTLVATESLQRALAIAQSQKDANLEMWTLTYWNRFDIQQMNNQDALSHGMRALDLARNLHDPFAERSARFHTIWALLTLGDAKEATNLAEPFLGLMETLRDQTWLENALLVNAWLASLKGDWISATIHSDKVLQGDQGSATGLGHRTMLEISQGHYESGDLYHQKLIEANRAAVPGPSLWFAIPAVVVPIAERAGAENLNIDIAYEAAHVVLESSPPPVYEVLARAGLALIAIRNNDLIVAQQQYDALKHVPGIMFFLAEFSSDRLLGLLARTMGNMGQATTHFEDALAFCRKAGYRPELAWTCCDYADALRERDDEGDRTKAISLLDEGLAISSGLGMRPLMERVLSRREILKA